MKTYSELIMFPTFEERFEYLKQNGIVSDPTFGGHRYLNQKLYQSSEWKSIRNRVMIRDNGCDLGINDRPIPGSIYIHHIEPITIDDLLNRDPKIFDLNNLISMAYDTHQALHYGDISHTASATPTVRKPGDTCPWRK